MSKCDVEEHASTRTKAIPRAKLYFRCAFSAGFGIKSAILTNAAGGIDLNYKQGALVVIRDHINLQSTNPLIGPNDERFGPRFPDMSQAYAKPYCQIALAEAKRLGIELPEGVYAALSGPSYETPAEIRYLRTIGADLVGMSTVPETIVARHMGIRVLGISCVTNIAARFRSTNQSCRSDGNRRTSESAFHRATSRRDSKNLAAETK